MSKELLFNDNWSFSKQPLHTALESIYSDSVNWTPLSLPHDWLIYDTHNLYENSEGWYRKNFTVTGLKDGRRIALRFEGVYMDSTVYVNGKTAGTWKYGYSTFEFDITDLLKEGNNEVMVRVVHESPNSRWYSGAGIYRNVWLKTYPSSHIAADGIYIFSKQTGDAWQTEVDTEIIPSGTYDFSSDMRICHRITDKDGNTVQSNESAVAAVITESGVFLHMDTLTVNAPKLWDINAPELYHLTTDLLIDGAVVESVEQTFGFRTLSFDTQKGFFLNGRHIKIFGVCEHHDLGCLGSAVNKTALRRQLALLRKMGANAIRTSHNMPAVELMELADEMGFLIVSEGFDMWERPKNPFDYARFFPEWAPKDVASWIRRDRNHPSIIMWSIGNEIYDTHADDRGQEVTILLKDLVLKHDPKCNAYVTIGSNFMPWENAQKCADIVKFAGYNYGEKYYEQHHKEHPDWIIYGSETASTVQSRGIYHFPYSQPVLSDDDEQCSSLGNSSTSWGAKSTESCITDDRDAAFSLGQFIWTGFDYIGEPTPYFTKNSYFGQIDTAGFKKDSFYIYQAEWTDYKKNPMVHIFPYWDFSEGQRIDVRVCSNAPKVELFFNGLSQGVFPIDHAHGRQLAGHWQIPYTKGELMAVAYDETDAIIAKDIKTSFGDAAALCLTPDKKVLTADGNDLIFVEISVLDTNGVPVENANNRVFITLTGPGRLIGLDNGDSTDYDQYKGDNRRLFSGKLLAVIASTHTPGTITLKAESKGLTAKEITLTALPYDNKSGKPPVLTLYSDYIPPCNTKDAKTLQSEDSGCYMVSLKDEIPVRKLELISPEGRILSKEKTCLPVHAVIHPVNATYEDIEWRVTNIAGVDSNIASIEAKGTEAVLTALGDGEVYVRCSTRNGSEKTRLYSQLEFSITGLGQADINPYEFVSAGIYTYGVNLTNGNDRGVATARDEESQVAFQRINFGDYGSDEITIPIFSLDSDEFSMDIWEGLPGEETASLLTTVTYNKPTIWNVYQEETYKLPNRLTGITTLCFVLTRKIHIKGFIFKKLEKAFEKLSVTDNNAIYGDTYTITPDAIEHIGNNVSIVFDYMDFGEAGTSKLVLCGHSPLDKNTIHIQFSGEDGNSDRQIVEFIYSEDYCEKEFDLQTIKGKQKVTFIFLPGCNFDFKWFRFQ